MKCSFFELFDFSRDCQFEISFQMNLPRSLVSLPLEGECADLVPDLGPQREWSPSRIGQSRIRQRAGLFPVQFGYRGLKMGQFIDHYSKK